MACWEALLSRPSRPGLESEYKFRRGVRDIFETWHVRVNAVVSSQLLASRPIGRVLLVSDWARRPGDNARIRKNKFIDRDDDQDYEVLATRPFESCEQGGPGMDEQSPSTPFHRPRVRTEAKLSTYPNAIAEFNTDQIILTIWSVLESPLVHCGQYMGRKVRETRLRRLV
ncbi:hypothetical protein PM082_013864 [Marasmius tenuissimus]|nr:hypothetical protein PM082_013864 [Marasmius tenuissimus]